MSRQRALGLGVGVLIALPAIVAIVCLVGRPWHPTDDLAIIDLRVRDVWSVHTPLTGLYSRPGWNHPGPVMFWMLGVVSAATGHTPWASAVGGAFFELVALVWLAWVTWKRSTRMLLAAGTVTALTYLGINADVFRQPWNPYIPIPFFLLFLFLVCLVATGGFRHLIGMAIVGTVIVQTHVGYLPIVAAGFAWAIACAVLDWRRDDVIPPRWRSTLAIAAGVGFALWIPPLVGVIQGTPGGLDVLADYFVSGGHQSVGLHNAIGIMAAEFRVVPPWLGGGDRLGFISADALPSSAWLLLIPFVLLLSGGYAAHRTRSREDMRMVGFAAVLLVVGIFAMSRADEARAYTLQWRLIVASFVVVTSVWSIAAAVAPRAKPWLRVGSVAVVLAVIVWGCTVRAVSEREPGTNTFLEARDPTLVQVMSQVKPPSHGAVLVRPYGTALPSLFDGVVDALDRDGVDVRVDPVNARIFGEQRVAPADRAGEVWYVVEQGSFVPALLGMRGARTIATTTPLSRSEEAELARLQRRLADQLRAAHKLNLVRAIDSSFIALYAASVPGVDHDLAQRVADLNARVGRDGGCRCTVVAVSGPGRLENPPTVGSAPR